MYIWRDAQGQFSGVSSFRFFPTLPADIQKVLLNAPYELTTWGREQVRKMEPVLLKNLVRYLELLLRWNRKINLTGVRDAGEMVETLFTKPR